MQKSALKQIRQKLGLLQSFEETTELDLTGIPIGRFNDDIRKHLLLCPKVETLVLCECSLRSLQNFPALNLTVIELSNNRLSDSCLYYLSNIGSLTQIICVGNLIESVNSLKQLSVLQKLVEVNFSENPVSEDSKYRETLFQSVKSLQIVDRKDKEGNPIDEEEEEFLDQPQHQSDDDDDQFYDDDDDDDYSEENQSGGAARDTKR